MYHQRYHNLILVLCILIFGSSYRLYNHCLQRIVAFSVEMINFSTTDRELQNFVIIKSIFSHAVVTLSSDYGVHFCLRTYSWLSIDSYKKCFNFQNFVKFQNQNVFQDIPSNFDF